MHLFRPLAPRRELFSGLRLALAVTLVLLVVSTPAWAQLKEASRVHVLLVADTDVQGSAAIGLGIDGVNVQRAFEELFNRSGKTNRYTLQLFTGDKVSPLNILNYYNNLKSNPTETLVFYYTGHGITDKTQGHMITTHRGFLPRKILLENMQKHNPQLVVLLTDCCANYGNPNNPFPLHFKAGSLNGNKLSPVQFLTRQLPQLPSIDDRTRPKPGGGGQVAVEPAPVQPGQGRDADLLSNLFFQHKGLVDMNAAEMGKSASGNANLGGSYFTLALVKQLRKTIKEIDRNSDGFAEWREFFGHLDSSTIQEAARAGFFQRPEAFSLGEAMK